MLPSSFMNNLVKYNLRFPESEASEIYVKGEFTAPENRTIEFHFPFWRPGRYEMGAFLKRVVHLKWDIDGEELMPERSVDFGFSIAIKKDEQLRFSYTLLCTTLDAGSSYVATGLKYINPIQSLFYVSNEKAQYHVQWKSTLPYMGQKVSNGNQLEFVDEQEMYDSPFFLSNPRESLIAEVEGVKIGMHFFGITSPIDLLKLEGDIQKMAQAQFKAMGGYPYKRYDFYVITVPKLAYHGVEHNKSCIILIGPEGDIGGDRYNELMGVSSHELFHVYNVKGLRTKDLVPYNFKHVPNSPYLFFAEGITSYLGDYFLWSSGVFSDEEYLSELNTLLKRYQLNHARLHKSLMDGSSEAWVDGYGGGPQHRNTNIYVDGSLWAWSLDWNLLDHSGGKVGLTEVYRDFYWQQREKTGLKSDIPFHFSDFSVFIQGLLPEEKWHELLVDGVRKPTDFLPGIKSLAAQFGLGFENIEAANLYSSLGILLKDEKVVSMHPDSPIYHGGVICGDTLRLTIKGKKFNARFEKALTGEHGILEGNIGEFDFSEVKWIEDSAWRRTWKLR
ncbi:MAG: putative metalloprotease with PDZ domain [Luteibaculaceae bacterium]